MRVYFVIAPKGVTWRESIREPEKRFGFSIPEWIRWAEHFRTEEAYIVPLTAEGEATVRLLRLNAPERVAERALSSPRPGSSGWIH